MRGRQQKKKKSLLVRNNQMFLSVAWIENRCFSGAVLQMSDAVDQMRPTAHEEVQTSEREMGTEKQNRKRGEEWGCLY